MDMERNEQVVIPQPSPRVPPLAESLNQDDLFDEEGFIKGSPVADEEGDD